MAKLNIGFYRWDVCPDCRVLLHLPELHLSFRTDLSDIRTTWEWFPLLDFEKDLENSWCMLLHFPPQRWWRMVLCICLVPSWKNINFISSILFLPEKEKFKLWNFFWVNECYSHKFNSKLHKFESRKNYFWREQFSKFLVSSGISQGI